jgi:putative FmdB family regulatory protein
MPTYTYFCEKHQEFESFHSITSQLDHCPECEKEGLTTKVVRLISNGTNFILTGGGWAADKYHK